MSKKVLQINSVCGIRSTGRICTDIAQELERRGHVCKVAYGRENVPSQYENHAVKIGSGLGVKTHALLSRLFDTTGFHSKRDTKKFIKWIKNYDPDVIHLHNLHGYYLNVDVLFRYLRSCGKKIVWTLHDCWPFTGHCSHFEHCRCNKWESGCHHCPQKKAYPRSVFWDGAKRNYRKKKALFRGVENLTIITPSQWLAGLVKKSFLAEYPVKVIHNGINLEGFKKVDGDFKARYGITEKQVVLGVASSWVEEKGLFDFYKLASALDEQYKVVLVGLSDGQLKDLPNNVIGLPRTNDIEELAEIYSAADVFVNMTRSDTYPTVNLEAQACGCPVITYATGGAPETVGNFAGNIVPQGDVETLVRLIQTTDLKTLCRMNVKSMVETVTDYVELYEST